MGVVRAKLNRTTPLPSPPPQGGREQTELAARLAINFKAPPHVHDVVRRAHRRRPVPGQGRDPLRPGRRRGRHGRDRTRAGFRQLIGFDMGGTSTDVSHFDGEFERTFETEVAGVRMRAPMMLIHTVAAGGGSILHFDGARFRVGPDSAGANPGPKSYRRGGPLTVTDANVMVGKLIPEFFPKIFGPRRTCRSTPTPCATPSRALAKDVGKPPEEVADGFIRIAVENMANAIKKISVQRGYDVDALRAQLLRRRRRAARLPRRRRARHDDGADPSLFVAALRLRHGLRRRARHAPAGDRAAARRRHAVGARKSAANSMRARSKNSSSRASRSSACGSRRARICAMPAPTRRSPVLAYHLMRHVKHSIVAARAKPTPTAAAR